MSEKETCTAPETDIKDTARGWVCPLCGNALSPYQDFCPFCYKPNTAHNSSGNKGYISITTDEYTLPDDIPTESPYAEEAGENYYGGGSYALPDDIKPPTHPAPSIENLYPEEADEERLKSMDEPKDTKLPQTYEEAENTGRCRDCDDYSPEACKACGICFWSYDEIKNGAEDTDTQEDWNE